MNRLAARLACWAGAGLLLAGLAGCGHPRVMHFPLPERAGEAFAGPLANSTNAAADNPRFRPPDEDQPVQISSDRLEYRNQGQITVFRGGVQVNQLGTWLFTPYLEVRSEDGTALARNGIRLVDHARGLTVTAREMAYQKDLSHVTAEHDVRLHSRDEQGVPLRVRSDRLEWWSEQREALASGAVVFHYRDITATAESMHYRQAEQILVLNQGDTRTARAAARPPVIRQGSDVLTGEEITIRIQQRKYEAKGGAEALIISSQERKPSLPGRKQDPENSGLKEKP